MKDIAIVITGDVFICKMKINNNIYINIITVQNEQAATYSSSSNHGNKRRSTELMRSVTQIDYK